MVIPDIIKLLYGYSWNHWSVIWLFLKSLNGYMAIRWIIKWLYGYSWNHWMVIFDSEIFLVIRSKSSYRRTEICDVLVVQWTCRRWRTSMATQPLEMSVAGQRFLVRGIPSCFPRYYVDQIIGTLSNYLDPFHMIFIRSHRSCDDEDDR